MLPISSAYSSEQHQYRRAGGVLQIILVPSIETTIPLSERREATPRNVDDLRLKEGCERAVGQSDRLGITGYNCDNDEE